MMVTAPLSTAETLRRILAGEADAAAWLYDSFAPRLFRRLSQRYGYLGREEIEDLVQETYLATFRRDGALLKALVEKVGEPISEAEIARFLWDQACGLASNRRRSAAVRKTSSMAPAEDTPSAEDGESRTIDRDLLVRLDSCLRSSARTYLYFKLRHRDGLSPEQISDLTGWSRKATYKLRQALDEAITRCAENLRLIESS
jgi:DNA-directed RNA polymerase specialized sigma24 family protein